LLDTAPLRAFQVAVTVYNFGPDFHAAEPDAEAMAAPAACYAPPIQCNGTATQSMLLDVYAFQPENTVGQIGDQARGASPRASIFPSLTPCACVGCRMWRT
jgi:hypothetical protein